MLNRFQILFFRFNLRRYSEDDSDEHASTQGEMVYTGSAGRRHRHRHHTHHTPSLTLRSYCAGTHTHHTPSLTVRS